MVLKREATPEDASSFLSDVFQQTDQHLNSFQSLTTLAEGIATGQGILQLIYLLNLSVSCSQHPGFCCGTISL